MKHNNKHNNSEHKKETSSVEQEKEKNSQQENLNGEKVPVVENSQGQNTEPAGSEKKDNEKPGRDKELEERLLRLMADFDNFRKRYAKEREELRFRANEDLILSLLPVMDHMAMAIESAKKHDAKEALMDGLKMVSQQMADTLAKFGLCAIKTEGAVFDPSFHEAIAHTPSEEVAENFIISETRKGYKLGDKLLRASQVIVSSGPASKSENNKKQN